jgi:phospholipid transport system substrate-binding protein
MRAFYRLFLTGVFAVFFSLVAFLSVRAGEPTDQIRLAMDKAIQVLNDPGYQSEDKKKERLNRLREIVNEIFDFDEMAKRALGSHWRQRSSTEQKEFVALFRVFLEKTHADKIDLYNGEKVLFSREVLEKDFAEVDSTVVNKRGETFSVIYRLRRRDDKWKVYDVVAEHISLVNNYRSQFSRVISNSSYEELVKKIKEKSG